MLDKSGSWYKVNYKGIVGYASSNYITITGSAGTATPSPSPSTAPSQKPGDSSGTTYTAKLKAGTGGLNVRSGAGTSYTKLTTIPEGVTFTVLDKSGSWYKVNYKGIVGYASSNYINIVTNAPSAPSTGGNQTSGGEKDDTSTYTAKLVSGTGSLRIRDGAGVSANTIGYINEGETFTVLDKGSNGWYRVSNGKVTGYSSSEYIEIIDGSSEKFGSVNVDPGSVLNIRSGASTEYTVIGSIPAKGKVVILQDLGNWLKISYNGTIGYVSAEFIIE